MKKKELAEIMVNYFRNRPTDVLTLKQLYGGLNLTTHPLKMLCADIVEEMMEDDFLVETEKGHYKLNEQGQVLTGTFVRKSNGKNAFIPDEGGEPILIAERNAAHAMNNDKVKVVLCAHRRRHEPEGQVIDIIERADTTYVGTLKVTKNYAFLLTETSTLANDIFIPKEKLKDLAAHHASMCIFLSVGFMDAPDTTSTRVTKVKTMAITATADTTTETIS